MRWLVVEPGPHFSVADVCDGWASALTAAGEEVVRYNLGDRLSFYEQAHLERDGEFVKAFDIEGAVALATKGITATAMEWWPDVVLVVSGFFPPELVYRVLRGRGMTVVTVCTESPYEDDRQIARAAWSDIVLLNDPTHIDGPRGFRSVNPNTYYVPHAYDPARHHPGDPDPDLASDVVFVGTGYPSRVELLEAVDWSGIDLTLAGNWRVGPGSPLARHLAHEVEECCPNEETVRLYQSARASFNIYRREATATADGWAMGPREVELAACGTFYVTEARGENRAVLPMVPTFETASELEKSLRWFLDHEDERTEIARQACDAVADRTFTANVDSLLTILR